MEFNALLRQKNIYNDGFSGRRPGLPVDFHQLEAAAKSKLSPQAFAYIAGGAGLESTQAANRTVWDKYPIVPRMLRDVSQRQLAVNFLGSEYPLPLFLCPIGVLELAHSGADLAVAAACKSLGIPMMVSNQASHSMEEIAKVLNGSPWFFQLYVSKSDELVLSFIRRAEQAGARGIVITLDTTMLGWRPRDLNLGSLPFLEGRGIAQYTSDAVFNKLMKDLVKDQSKKKINIQSISNLIRLARRLPGPWISNLKGDALDAIRLFTQIYSRPDLNWDTIAWIKSATRLPIILKGIQHPQDALKSLQLDIDAIYVSNHGGRQVDGAVGSLDALVEIKEVVKNNIPVLFDSGIRCGADIAKALALGASMAGIGRPYTYALALDGARGVESLIQNFVAELELTMALAGAKSISELEGVLNSRGHP
ncbi:MAG: alpha-hydroxy-acid oxidizing protein [Saprospiraceae bacterium]|nr:alpha-hydroxy-acid oxidizing protein [Saprospiraceae bacterium]